MTRLLLSLLFVSATMPAHAVQDPAATGSPSRLLQIEATVVDEDGKPVTDLKQEELEIWIGGYRIPIASLESVTPGSQERPGRLIVLLLDDITLPNQALPRTNEVARRFVSRMLPGDRMAVVLLNGGVVEITDDPSRLRQRIDAFKQTIGLISLDQIGAHLLTTLASVARNIVEAPEQRKTIVAIGSGWLLDTPVPPAQLGRDLRPEWFDALRALAVADATYYVIDPGGVGGSRTTGSQGLARETGGHAFMNTNDLTGAADRILRELDHYYVIRVGDPPVGQKSALRELDVKVLRRGVSARAPRSIPGGGAVTR
jgi:VWFA-related protein